MKGRYINPAGMEPQMFNSIIRKTALALVAVSSIAVATPTLAAGWDDSEIIFAEDGFRHEERRRPVYDHEVRREVLSPREISRALRHQGYREVREIDFRHDGYRVIAVRHNGAVVRLKVSGRSGRVISERRIGWVRAVPAYEPRHPRPGYPAPRHHGEPGFSIEFGWSSER
jgi:hypothetical protein